MQRISILHAATSKASAGTVCGSQWAQADGGNELSDAHLSPGVTEIDKGGCREREIQLIWGSVEVQPTTQ